MAISVYTDATYENRLPMAEYCYCGDDWHAIGFLSVTTTD